MFRYSTVHSFRYFTVYSFRYSTVHSFRSSTLHSFFNSIAFPWLCSPSPKKSLLQLLNTLNQDVHTAFAATEVHVYIQNDKTTTSDHCMEVKLLLQLQYCRDQSERHLYQRWVCPYSMCPCKCVFTEVMRLALCSHSLRAEKREGETISKLSMTA